MIDSKLLGRGGAAFPTGRKWEAVARQPGRPHYLSATPTSPSPGTFKDRVIIEGDPFSLIEAMTIAGYATGCERGYIYLRGEYPLAHRASRARDRAGARPRGFLGDDMLGRGFDFDIEMRKGAGAYICGEETAMFNSIEGYRGEPRNKPPFPVDRGLFGKPTVVNNVETLVNVLPIVLEGGAAFADDRHRTLDRARSCSASRGASSAPASTRCRSATTLRELLELAGGVSGRADAASGAARRRRRQLRHARGARPAAHVRGHARRRRRRSAPASCSCSTRRSTSPALLMRHRRASSATSPAASACRAASAPCARRRRSPGCGRAARAERSRTSWR